MPHACSAKLPQTTRATLTLVIYSYHITPRLRYASTVEIAELDFSHHSTERAEEETVLHLVAIELAVGNWNLNKQ